MMVEHRKAGTDERHTMESGTIARNAKAAKLSDTMLNEMDYAARAGYQGEVVHAGRKTVDALLKRGMITYDYNATKFAANKHWLKNPILTVVGWAVVCPEGRPADAGRMTLEEAWADAHPAATCGNRWKHGKDACVRDLGHRGAHRTTVTQEAHSFSWFDNEGVPAAAPITVDFDTRLELASVGMDVLLSQVSDKPDETAPVVSAAIEEAAELLEAEAVETLAFTPNTVLKAAGDVIRVRGWAQGVMVEEDGRVCALGAISVAAKSQQELDDAMEEMYRRIHATPEWDGLGIGGWNDRLDRTEDQVLSLLF